MQHKNCAWKKSTLPPTPLPSLCYWEISSVRHYSITAAVKKLPVFFLIFKQIIYRDSSAGTVSTLQAGQLRYFDSREEKEIYLSREEK